MKIALITDTHMGVRTNCTIFNNYFIKFFNNIFFPYLKNNNIKVVIHCGDLGEYRKQINTQILNSWNFHFFEPLRDFTCYFLTGNHDIFYKQSNEISLQTSLQLDKLFEFNLIHQSPETILIDNRKIDLIPWISNSNRKQIETFINTSTSPVLCSHLELSGVLMTPDQICRESQIPIENLLKYHKVISGHFHIRSINNNIHYIGTPYQMIWSDFGYPKGFAILDTETLKIEYINNPYTIFAKIIYEEIIQESPMDISKYGNNHIKLYINSQVKKSKLDNFIHQLEKVNPLSLIVQNNYQQPTLLQSPSTFSSSQETIFYIKTYINNLFQSQETHLDPEVLTNKLYQIYTQAQTLTF